MIKKITAIALLALSAASAQAEERGTWFVQGGIGYIDIPDNDNVSIGGTEIPGAGSTFSSDTTLTAGVGYYFHENFSVLGFGGIPPETETVGTGPVVGGLTVGSLKYAPVSVFLNYHIPTKSKWKPFLGVGVIYNITFDVTGEAVENLEIDNAFGFGLRAGIEYHIDDHWGAYLSVEQAYVSHTATGNIPAGLPGIGGASVQADVDLDPTVVQAGVSYRF